MARMIKVEEKEEKPKKKANIDLSKIGQVISENSDTIEIIAGALLGTSKKTTRRTTSKRRSTTKKRTTKSSKTNSSLDAIDIIGSLLKK